jgi:phage baseplate assembly protein V
VEDQAQTIQVEGRDGETLEKVTNIGQYGLASSAPVGGEVIVGCINGDKDLPFILCVGDARTRPQTLKESETLLYSKNGNEILLNDAGEVVINGGTDYAVKFNELQTAFDSLSNTVATHVHPFIGVAPTVEAATKPTATPPTADMSSAKVDEVRL